MLKKVAKSKEMKTGSNSILIWQYVLKAMAQKGYFDNNGYGDDTFSRSAHPHTVFYKLPDTAH